MRTRCGTITEPRVFAKQTTLVLMVVCVVTVVGIRRCVKCWRGQAHVATRTAGKYNDPDPPAAMMDLTSRPRWYIAGYYYYYYYYWMRSMICLRSGHAWKKVR